MLVEPLAPVAAKKLIRLILQSGTVDFTQHALEELANDRMSTGDALNVLRGGTVEHAELVGTIWRYRVRTAKMVVVIQFRQQTRFLVITAWRLL